MSASSEYTAQTTADITSSILHECITKVIRSYKNSKTESLDSQTRDAIENHPERSQLVEAVDADVITFNETATFYRDGHFSFTNRNYLPELEVADFKDSHAQYDSTVVETAIGCDIPTADVSYEMQRAIKAQCAVEGKSELEIQQAIKELQDCNSIIDEDLVALMIASGICASRIPSDIKAIFNRAHKSSSKNNNTDELSKRVYDKLHHVVRSVNSKIAKSVRTKQPKSAFLAHARLWKIAKKMPMNAAEFKEEHQKFRQEINSVRV